MTKSDKLKWAYHRPGQNMVYNHHAKFQHERAIQQHGMHGGWHTRMRLASAPQGGKEGLGKWERISNITNKIGNITNKMGYWAVADLACLLPPECVALHNGKIRSHRRGLSIDTILEASEKEPTMLWRLDRTHLRWLLDQPNITIETIANMRRLARLGPGGA